MLLLSCGYKEEYLKSKELYIHCITWIGTTVVLVPLLAESYAASENVPYAMLCSALTFCYLISPCCFLIELMFMYRCWTKTGRWEMAVDIYIPIPVFLIFNTASLIYIVIVYPNLALFSFLLSCSRSYCLFLCYLLMYKRYNKDFQNFREVQTRLLRTRSIKKMRSFLWRISFYPCFAIITYISILVAQICIYILSSFTASSFLFYICFMFFFF